MNSRGVKAKGYTAERAVVDYLRSRGIPAERRRLGGSSDTGDVGGWAGWVCEIKNEKRLDLAGYLRELETEVRNANLKLDEDHKGVVVVKRRGTVDAGDYYAVMKLSHLMDLVSELQRASGTEPHSLT